MRFAPGAYRLAAIPLLLGLGTVLVVPVVSVVFLCLAVGVLVFYRDPVRIPPSTGIVAPADGRVTVLRSDGDQVRVGVFMNVTDVHVNRAPLDTTIESITHESGGHKPAFRKESERNERLILECSDHQIILIAGWFARRITPYISAGQSIDRGDRIGHIAFGSRADIVLPATVDLEDVTVSIGESVRAGETVIAHHPDAS